MHHHAPPPPPPRPARRRTTGAIALVLVLALSGVLSACDPSTTPATPSSTGLWISRAEVAKLPASGAAWNKVLTAARSSWGTADLSDNNATHDTSTLAGALVAVRTRDAAMTAKTRAALMSVTRVTRFSRVLELSRNITSYVIAADLINLPEADKATFTRFLRTLPAKRLEGHSGGTDLRSTALRSPNNWGAMARAALTAIDLYVGDRADLAKVAVAHRAWLGESAADQLVFTSTAWHANANKAGINRRGATVRGRNADGVLPEDQRRSGEPTTGAAAQGSYPWEALQGALVTGVLLHRARVVGIDSGDMALRRAFNWLYWVNRNPADADDLWQPWVINRVTGMKLPTQPTKSPGKNMAWTDWTHGPTA